MNAGLSIVSKVLVIFGICLLPGFSWSVQKAKITSPEIEIYSKADFDSDIIEVVKEGETYLISDKTYGPFYRIKLKDGKIGYVVDYVLDIEGKGKFQEKDPEIFLYEDAPEQLKKTNSGDPEETIIFGRQYGGPTIQLINFHENTLGGDQVDDLPAVGYKNIGDMAWSVLGSFKVPKYYVNKTGGTANGFKLWADFGITSNIVEFGASSLRFSGTLFTQISFIQLETAQRKYDMTDITAGLAAELGWIFRFEKSAIDIALKYYFDKNNYAGLGLSYLF